MNGKKSKWIRRIAKENHEHGFLAALTGDKVYDLVKTRYKKWRANGTMDEKTKNIISGR